MAKIESIHPHVGDAYIYQGVYIVPDNCTYKIEGNKIIITQSTSFKVGDWVHSLDESNTKYSNIVIGQVKEILSPECFAIEGYSRGYSFFTGRIVLHSWLSKPAEEWEITMFHDALNAYKEEFQKWLNYER